MPYIGSWSLLASHGSLIGLPQFACRDPPTAVAASKLLRPDLAQISAQVG